MKKEKWEEDFVNLLRDVYAQHRQGNSRFSLRAFAKKIGLASGTLTVILNEKRNWNITVERAVEIIDRLELKTSRKNALLVKMGLPPVVVSKEMNLDDYPTLMDWTYQPILMAFSLPVEKRNAGDISAALGIPPAKVESAIDDAVTRGLLVKNSAGHWERPEEMLTTSDGVPNEIIRKHHQLNLDVASRSLNELPAPERDFTSFTFAGDKRKMNLLKEEIRKLYHKASLIMDGGEDNGHVFRLSIQLFPMELDQK